MASEATDAKDDALTIEETQLRAELGTLHDSLLGGLRRDVHHQEKEIDAAERRVRSIVLRLTQIERERIELNIARSL